uniref:alkaline phosphatase n=1 Tax=Megaselia scalaris TaxID=36166 RepID=T1GRP4_MEGSC
MPIHDTEHLELRRSDDSVKMMQLTITHLAKCHHGREVPKNEDSIFWLQNGRDTLNNRLRMISKEDNLKAKNIILCLGGGMGLTTITAARIYKGQVAGQSGEEASLVFDNFPYSGLAKVYNTDTQVPDAGSGVTAIYTGTKTKQWALSMDNTCNLQNSKAGSLSTFMEWAQEAGKRTGFVTNTRISNPPLAGLFSKICNSRWECDSSIPQSFRGVYNDSSLQFLENGRKFNVVLAGGLSSMGAYDSEEQLSKILPDPNPPFCLFRNGHMSYSIDRQAEEPSLTEMTQKAIEILNVPDSKGFVLLIENGHIDHAHHMNLAEVALNEVLEFDRAIQLALKMTNESETLVIVTSDHSQPMTIIGDPKRGNDILGYTDESKTYETLTYSNGPELGLLPTGASQSTGNKIFRSHRSLYITNISTHSGEDVPVFAKGPGSALLGGVYEQSFIGHVISYAGSMGPNKEAAILSGVDVLKGVWYILAMCFVFTI